MKSNLSKLQQRFEHLTGVQYMLSCMSKPNPNAQFPYQFEQMETFDVFFAKKEDGYYVSDTLSSAWWAFEAAFKEFASEEDKQKYSETSK